MKKILVLGGSGFLGQNITDLLEQNHKTISCDIAESAFHKKQTIIKKDPYATKTDIDFDTCIHLIDHKVPLSDFQVYESKLATNLQWGEGKHLILMSSSVLYANPSSDYGKRKQMLEDFWADFCAKRKIHLTTLRLFNTFGPYQRPFVQGSLVANILFNHLSGKPTEIYDLDAKRTFVFAKDVARTIEFVIKNKVHGRHDLTGSNHKSISELINLLEEKVTKEKISVIDKKKKEDIFCPIGDSSLISQIGESDFSESLQETFLFYSKNIPSFKRLVIKSKALNDTTRANLFNKEIIR